MELRFVIRLKGLVSWCFWFMDIWLVVIWIGDLEELLMYWLSFIRLFWLIIEDMGVVRSWLSWKIMVLRWLKIFFGFWIILELSWFIGLGIWWVVWLFLRFWCCSWNELSEWLFWVWGGCLMMRWFVSVIGVGKGVVWMCLGFVFVFLEILVFCVISCLLFNVWYIWLLVVRMVFMSDWWSCCVK